MCFTFVVDYVEEGTGEGRGQDAGGALRVAPAIIFYIYIHIYIYSTLGRRVKGRAKLFNISPQQFCKATAIVPRIEARAREKDSR